MGNQFETAQSASNEALTRKTNDMSKKGLQLSPIMLL